MPSAPAARATEPVAAAAPVTAPATATALAPRIPVNALSVGSGVVLPRTLDPRIDNGVGDDSRRTANPRFIRPTNGPMRARAGTPDPIVRSCQAALISAARAYGALAVEAVSGGRATPAPSGGFLAPITARVTYSSGRIGQVQQTQVGQAQTDQSQTDTIRVRQASIVCQLDAAGQVVGLR